MKTNLDSSSYDWNLHVKYGAEFIYSTFSSAYCNEPLN